MSCGPEILLFVEECEAQEVEERRKKFIKEEEEKYMRRVSPTFQAGRNSLIDEAREEVGSQRNDEISQRILEEEGRVATRNSHILLAPVFGAVAQLVMNENTTREKRERDLTELKQIINNPTLTILQNEEGSVSAPGPSGQSVTVAQPTAALRAAVGCKSVIKKCRVCPWLEKGGGTGYLRWVVGDTTHYLAGHGGDGSGTIYKITPTGHVRLKDMLRVGRSLYNGLAACYD